MRILFVFLGGLALSAGFGPNSRGDIYRGGYGYNDMTLNYLGMDRNAMNYDQNLDQAMLLDKNVMNRVDTSRNILTRDRLNIDQMGMGRDLKISIMNDKDILRKQKFILDIMRNVYTTLIMDDVRDVAPIEGEMNYNNYDRVIPFFRMYGMKMFLPRGRIFAVSDRVQLRQAVLLFNLFYYAKDFNIFQRNVLWARNNVNEDMFIYSLTAAIFQRRDMIGIKLPSHYEVMPHKFHTALTITNAVNTRMGNLQDKVLIVKNNYTSDITLMNDEAKLAYFTEDIGLNLYHYYLFLQYPYWLGGEEFGLYKQMRGEGYLLLIQQILARYNMERLSHGMGPIKDISLNIPLKNGYNSFLRHYNGLGYSVRKNYYDVYTTGDYYLISRVKDYERRIRDAIDKGYVIGKDGSKIDLYGKNGIDLLGNIIQSNKDSVNDRFYGGLVRLMRKLIGGGYVKNVDHNNVLPSVMEYYETALRDPATYQVYKRVLKLLYQYKNTLRPYTTEDLLVKGVRIMDIRTTKLVTYCDQFDVDVSTIVDHNIRTQTKDTNVDNVVGDKLVFARHTRLNHKPFAINLDVTSDRAQKVVVRLFIGPKYDQFGKKIQLKDNRDNFMELDKFVFDLPAGRVTIKRDSRDFNYVVRDRTTYVDLYKNIVLNKDLNKLLDLNIVESHCGFPDRLLLPRGWVGGMPLQIFAIITRATNFGKGPTILTKCGRNTQLFHVDDFKLGFPFDRYIDETEFYTTNMLFKDILIYHEGMDTNIGMNDYNGMRDITDTMGNLNPGLDVATIQNIGGGRMMQDMMGDRMMRL
ncbi:unnamed protein product [Hermetia illucens]|uniref:Hexamerin n=1 Tax=Hermetia illucens TaxID=343691 RepID=A0A7R8YPS8_HERIL|nr:larval serum protein 1 gamma chain-like [Hermetia illucens]CAD7081066.1 unnamed protein product [Hermetia illucens]